MRTFQQDGLPAGRKGVTVSDGWLCKVFICCTERIVLFIYQIFKRDFPPAAASYAPCCVYGSVANDDFAKGIMRVPDMLLILFVFGHGKSPFLDSGRGRQRLLLSPS
ncbi:hypothetical protein [Bacteroides congonensis]|uniref:hypothetical protein n=1 Tax=Bacteroides congonensis TaxID=1871006 RepID=UPI0026743F40|nr:hypothetical protein [Bacteroides congonensis]